MQEPAEQFNVDMCRICMGAMKIQHDIFEHTLVDSVLSHVYDDPEQECAQYGELKLCDIFAIITAVDVRYRRNMNCVRTLLLVFNLTMGLYARRSIREMVYLLAYATTARGASSMHSCCALWPVAPTMRCANCGTNTTLPEESSMTSSSNITRNLFYQTTALRSSYCQRNQRIARMLSCTMCTRCSSNRRRNVDLKQQPANKSSIVQLLIMRSPTLKTRSSK